MASGDIKLKYSTQGAVTITLTSLSQATGRESTAVVNTTNLFTDATVYVQLKTASGTHGSDQLCNVFFYGSEDGTDYTDPATGTNSVLGALGTGHNLRGPFPVIFGTSTTGLATKKAVIGSVAQFFGNVLPPKWGVVVENRTNVVLSATASDCAVTYTGVYHNVET